MAKNKEALYDELVDIQNKIDHHPMISGPHAEASSLVEIMKEQGYSHEEIENPSKTKDFQVLSILAKILLAGCLAFGGLTIKKII